MDDSTKLLAYLGVSATVKLVGTILTYGQKPNNLERVGHISKVTLFPGKSMRGIDLDNGTCTKIGLRHPKYDIDDRSILVVKDGRYQSAKLVPKIVTIPVEIEGRLRVILKGEGVPPLFIYLDRDPSRKVVVVGVLGEKVEGEDCGDEAAEWISKVLGASGLRLVVGTDGLKKRKLTERKDKWSFGSKPEDQVIYNNLYPYMISSEASLKDFNQHLGEEFPMSRFRPNFVVSGCAPYDEDSWEEIWIGDLKFSNKKPCVRCPVTTVDPAKGVIHEKNEPLNTLSTYRNICRSLPKMSVFGALLVLDSKEGSINVGDAVYVKRKITEGSFW